MYAKSINAQAPEWEQHAYALDVSGYTHIPGQVNAQERNALRACAAAALTAASAAFYPKDQVRYYHQARCVYCWGDDCVRILEHDAIHALASRMLGSYQLWDEVVLSVAPTPLTARDATVGWHRDFHNPQLGSDLIHYLWFFICLEDVTPENGATWVVPGSHKFRSRFERPLDEVWAEDILEQYPSRQQLCARAGDMLVLNPGIIHSPGRNLTSGTRYILSVSCCSTAVQPLADHWAIAGPSIQSCASARVRQMLQGGRKPLDTTWSVLPTGWRTGVADLVESPT